MSRTRRRAAASLLGQASEDDASGAGDGAAPVPTGAQRAQQVPISMCLESTQAGGNADTTLRAQPMGVLYVDGGKLEAGELTALDVKLQFIAKLCTTGKAVKPNALHVSARVFSEDGDDDEAPRPLADDAALSSEGSYVLVIRCTRVGARHRTCARVERGHSPLRAARTLTRAHAAPQRTPTRSRASSATCPSSTPLTRGTSARAAGRQTRRAQRNDEHFGSGS